MTFKAASHVFGHEPIYDRKNLTEDCCQNKVMFETRGMDTFDGVVYDVWCCG